MMGSAAFTSNEVRHGPFQSGRPLDGFTATIPDPVKIATPPGNATGEAYPDGPPPDRQTKRPVFLSSALPALPMLYMTRLPSTRGEPAKPHWGGGALDVRATSTSQMR